MKNSITVLSPAKINLGLDIKERLPNGYHDVRMVMQSLDLCDTVHVHRVAYSNPEDRITCSSPGTDLPTDKSNLALKAFTMLFDEFELEGGMHIILEKKIPLAAGLAGGSGDAAAVLTAVNELFELGLSDEELCARGVQIGAEDDTRRGNRRETDSSPFSVGRLCSACKTEYQGVEQVGLRDLGSYARKIPSGY